MPIKKLKEFLNLRGIKYVIISHSPAYTAMEAAESADIPGRELVKTVMVNLDGQMAMAVLSSSRMVDFDLLKKAAGAEEAELAAEDAFKDLFPGCQAGAMPPFGNLYGMDVYVDDSLGRDEEIAFAAGSHSELIRLSYNNYIALVEAVTAPISRKA